MEKRMYKLLIADDEYWTREKIRSMILWEEYQIIFMNPAQDGEEVLKMIARDKPDILITDINMPFINGVDLVKQVKKEHPEIVVLVISGYDDFAYVKETLVAGAINYLLKPVAKIDLIHAVSRALEIISENEENKQQILKASSLLQDRELSLLIEKEHTVVSIASLSETGMDAAGCSIMLIKLHELQSLMSQYKYDMNYLSYSLKKRLREIAQKEDLLIFNNINRSNEFLVVCEMEIVEQKLLAVKILEGLKQEIDSPITIAVSERSYSIESLHNAYVQSISVMMTRPYDRKSVILFSSREKDVTANRVTMPLSQELERQLKSLLKSGNEKAIREFLENKAGFSACEKWSYLEVKQVMKRVVAVYMEHLLQQGVSKKNVQELERLDQMSDKTIECLDKTQLYVLLEEMLNTVLAERKSEITGNIRDCVKEAIIYIDENYFEELTLSSLAEKYAVESSYFSRIFKQETGENLMLYISGKRIEKAKELMAQPQINITEVAFMVGNDDYTYFSKVFKKMTGMSPRDYRCQLFQNSPT